MLKHDDTDEVSAFHCQTAARSPSPAHDGATEEQACLAWVRGVPDELLLQLPLPAYSAEYS